jgi:ribosome-associated heat shock protein Hsp15
VPSQALGLAYTPRTARCPLPERPVARSNSPVHNGTVTGTRIDKWLWAARFFKTRSLAARACDLGRVECNRQTVKPAREVRPGDLLEVRTESGTFGVEVLLLSEIRGPAPVARTLYRETEQSVANRQRLAEERRAAPAFETGMRGKPSKRDRRQHARLRGRT